MAKYLKGSKTYSKYSAMPRGGKRTPSYFQKKHSAEVKFNNSIDRKKIKEIKLDPKMLEHNEFARMDPQVKYEYYSERLKEYKADLQKLIQTRNKRKIEFMRPVIEKQIDETQDILNELRR
jgi:hypothetical protein